MPESETHIQEKQKYTVNLTVKNVIDEDTQTRFKYIAVR
jgi:PKD repeat protein